MKTIFTIAITICVLYGYAQEAEVGISSKITQVTVFLEGAQITRTARVSVAKGVSILKLEKLSADIQDRSIQVEGPSDVKILSASSRINYIDELKKPEKISQLISEQEKLHNLIDQQKSMVEVYIEEESILKTNKSIGGEKGVEIEVLKTAMEYFRQRLTDIRHQIFKSRQDIKTYEQALSKIEAQLVALRNDKHQPTSEVLVKISASKSETAEFEIKYLVTKAKWYPSYDIRAKVINAPVNITYKANISQSTGEDWDDVAFTISSGNPANVGSQPILQPWYLGFNNSVASHVNQEFSGHPGLVKGRVVDDAGAGMPGVNVVIKGTTVGTVTDVGGHYSLPLTADATTLVFSFVGYVAEELPVTGGNEINLQMKPDITSLSEVVVSGYGTEGGDQSNNAYSGRIPGVSISRSKVKKSIVATPVIRQTNVEYLLDEPFTVKSDGETRMTDMIEYEMEASFEYYAVPKLNDEAFLTAKILHWDEYNFLEGEANLFFEGKYVGKSVLDTRTTVDTLSFSLGRDGNVIVKREKKKDYSSNQFIGSNRKSSYAFEISVRNKKAQPINIVIIDQIPVSNTKELDVDRQEVSGADLNEANGMLKWKKKIEASKTETIHLKYAVKYPRGSTVMLE